MSTPQPRMKNMAAAPIHNINSNILSKSNVSVYNACFTNLVSSTKH